MHAYTTNDAMVIYESSDTTHWRPIKNKRNDYKKEVKLNKLFRVKDTTEQFI